MQQQVKNTEQGNRLRVGGKTNENIVSGPLRFDPEMEMQDTLGNHGVLLRYGLPIQTKLQVSDPNDENEREADRVAEAVMRMPELGQQRQPALRRSAEIVSSCRSQARSYHGQGDALPDALRWAWGQHCGDEYSQVRVHTDERANAVAEALNARAFTIGKDIVFGKGEYQLQSYSGRLLLAHELAHVSQNMKNSTNSMIIRTKPASTRRPLRVQTFSVEPIESSIEEIDRRLALQEDNINVKIQEWTYPGVSSLRHGINDAAHSFRNWFEDRPNTPDKLNTPAFLLTIAQSLSAVVAAIIGGPVAGLTVAIVSTLTRQGRFHLAQGYDPKADARGHVRSLEQKMIAFSNDVSILYNEFGKQLKAKSRVEWNRIGLGLIQDPPALRDAQEVLYTQTCVPRPDRPHGERILRELIYQYLDWEMLYRIGESIFFMSKEQYEYTFSPQAQARIRQRYRLQAASESRKRLHSDETE